MLLPKKILITGASSGFGEAMAYRFARAGCDLVLTYAHNQEKVLAVQRECLLLGASAVDCYRLIIEQPRSLDDFLSFFLAKHQRLDILLNNAGLTAKGSLKDLDPSFIQRQIDINLTGIIKITSRLLPYVDAFVFNIGSNLSFHGQAGMSVYAASKFGLRGFTQSLAREYKNIKVYLLNPGNLGDKDNFFANTLSKDTAAEIIFQFASGHLAAESGADVQLREYLYGSRACLFLKFFLSLKKFFRFILNIFKYVTVSKKNALL